MKWQGVELRTYGEILHVVSRITTPEDAAAFMAAYRAENPHADENIGYLTGYLSQDQMVEKLRLFGVEHPVFGGPKSASKISPSDAFAAGVLRGEKSRREAAR